MKHLMVLICVMFLLASTDEIAASASERTRPGAATPPTSSGLNFLLSQSENFERYLKEHPEDESRREEALRWYARLRYCKPERTVARLKHHTFKMIEYHPSNMHVFFNNVSVFYSDPGYRLQVIQRLEGQLENDRANRELLWTLAMTCQQGAVPPTFSDPESRERFVRYCGLRKDTVFPGKVDSTLAEKAVRYYRSAIKAAGDDRFYVAFYSSQLAALLLELDEVREALNVCRDALPRAEEISKPGLLVTYGRCLRTAGRLEEAKEILSQVRSCDKEGDGDGPGCHTTDAEIQLGLVALKEGDLVEASRYLLSSCDVRACCHSTTKGFPLTLARKLLEAGEHEAVVKFCRTILEKFMPGQKETEALLQRAVEAGTRQDN